jgi:hypothetical protein
MDYNKTTITIGKIKSYDQATGEIVSQEGIFLFTKEDISEEELININDMVLFRGEEIQGQKKAFFIRHLNPSKDISDQVYTKTKKIKFFREND